MKSAVYRRFRRGRFFYHMAGLGKFKIANIDAKDGARGDNYGALDYILEFSYVPRPMISVQGIHSRGWNRFDDLSHTSGKLLSEVPHQERNVPLALPQGRDVDGKNIQSKKEI